MDRDLWTACADWVMLALAKGETAMSPIDEALAITRGAQAMIEAGAHLHDGKLLFPNEA